MDALVIISPANRTTRARSVTSSYSPAWNEARMAPTSCDVTHKCHIRPRSTATHLLYLRSFSADWSAGAGFRQLDPLIRGFERRVGGSDCVNDRVPRAHRVDPWRCARA